MFGFNYESLSQLKDVKKGVTIEDLLIFTELKVYNESNEICEKNKGRASEWKRIENVCVICQDNIEIESIIRVLQCKHLFHVNCIDRWFCENKKCPLCKKMITDFNAIL